MNNFVSFLRFHFSELDFFLFFYLNKFVLMKRAVIMRYFTAPWRFGNIADTWEVDESQRIVGPGPRIVGAAKFLWEPLKSFIYFLVKDLWAVPAAKGGQLDGSLSFESCAGWGPRYTG